MHRSGAQTSGMGEPEQPWLCLACERSVHDKCFGPVACECPACHDPAAPWLPPDRRTALRQIAADALPTIHLPAHEQAYITGLIAHRAERQEAEDRRG